MIRILPRIAPSFSTTAVITSQSLNKGLEGALSRTHKVSNSNTKFDLARPKPQVPPKPDKKRVLTSYNANSVKDNTRELRQVNKLDMKKFANVVACIKNTNSNSSKSLPLLKNKMNCITQPCVSVILSAASQTQFINESRPAPIINKDQGIPTPPPMPNVLPSIRLASLSQDNAGTVESRQTRFNIKPTENNLKPNVMEQLKAKLQERGQVD